MDDVSGRGGVVVADTTAGCADCGCCHCDGGCAGEHACFAGPTCYCMDSRWYFDHTTDQPEHDRWMWTCECDNFGLPLSAARCDKCETDRPQMSAAIEEAEARIR